jgi:DNA-binding LacI/PurR family transcriptional regulator
VTTAGQGDGDTEPGSRLTVARVADLAGVSAPTVSKVIHGRADVSAATRANVERVLREQGYRRQVRQSRRTKLVELVLHEFESAYAYAMEVLKGVTEAAEEAHLGVVISQFQGDRATRAERIRDLVDRRPSGVISVYLGTDADLQHELISRKIPMVLVDPSGEPGHDVPSVGANNWGGALAATRHLLDLGHRRIANITGPQRVLNARARFDGYRAAMDAASVPVDPALVSHGNWFFEDGLEQGLRMLRAPDPATAFVTGNDVQAMGVYAAAASLGLRIPDDVSVVGFDDLPMPHRALPPSPLLTSVRQPLREMAATATRMMVTLAQGETLAQDRVEFATRLMIRGSTAPPRR